MAAAPHKRHDQADGGQGGEGRGQIPGGDGVDQADWLCVFARTRSARTRNGTLHQESTSRMDTVIREFQTQHDGAPDAYGDPGCRLTGLNEYPMVLRLVPSGSTATDVSR